MTIGITPNDGGEDDIVRLMKRVDTRVDTRVVERKEGNIIIMSWSGMLIRMSIKMKQDDSRRIMADMRGSVGVIERLVMQIFGIPFD